MKLFNMGFLVWAQVPGLPAPIENMILRYVKQKADWWTQVVRTAACVPAEVDPPCSEEWHEYYSCEF